MSITHDHDAMGDLDASIDPITGSPDDFDGLLELVGDRPLVLLGEPSHGTAEAYAARARITRRLIEEAGFNAVAVEADWPDAYRVNRYVRGEGRDRTAWEALSDFQRFPSWMWRNREVERFVEWLRDRNASITAPALAAGFYGLDLYSLHTSVEEVIRYLERKDPTAAEVARRRYRCLDHVGSARLAPVEARDVLVPCEREVVAQLIDLRSSKARLLALDGLVAADEHFVAERNATLVRNAERYYREMYRGRSSSWNLRDHHMAETLEALVHHLTATAGRAKIVVWEHNSHLGDARATEMAARGEVNVGQLVRSGFGDRAVLVGFTTYEGEVTAASDWGAPTERKRVRPALPGSCEALFHTSTQPSFFLRTGPQAHKRLVTPRLERAIGVIYRPETERQSHWFRASLAQQFDGIVHLDRTSAVEPLELTSTWLAGEPPETYPSGL